LSIVEDVVTGLPVSDHDHGVNGLEFNDHGDLFIQVGGNTNAGVPGPLSQSYLQKENYLSAATLIARGVTSNSFDGTIKYDVNGNMVAGFDVQVYAAGLRNPFDLVLHSNGRLYGTDNGPNLKFGGKSLSCTEDGPEPFHKDKLVLLEEGSFYGHANRKRGETDPR
jgi:glucose/arabinose dehydrogenase